MPARLEFCLLGPLTVQRDGVAVPVPPGKQRALLAVLLLRAGQPVTADQLAELLWAPATPPPSAIVTVRNYVKRLRQALGAAGQDRIVTLPRGYLIRVADGELDITRMEHELTAARGAAGDADWQQARRHADAAIELWRGEPLCDADLPMLGEQEVLRLTELWLQAHELRIEADLRLGRAAGVVADLRQLALANPLREHLHALLMLGLYRCGRRAEALEAYRQARDVLIQEIGGDPGPELQALHRQILTDDPALAPPPSAVPRAGVTAGPLGPGRPRQLPAAVRCFTGREVELATLTGLLVTAQAHAAPTVLITAIGGTAGVGKTALAIWWAHQVADQFPDGQLYVNLRGYDVGQPVRPGDALAGFLTALGLPGPQIPAEVSDRAAAYRSLLDGKRMLIVLDNAREAQHVRPLLPGAPGCVALVTSRDTLAGLVAREGATRVELDALSPDEAVTLLRGLIGQRVGDEPGAAALLAERCCRLPLALRVAAELAATRPAVSLADLAAELDDQQRRLDLLDAGGDPATAVRAVFSWSYRQLGADAARAFTMIGLHPGADWDCHAIAALMAAGVDATGPLLEALARVSLIQRAGSSRYGMHDLLRAYAKELALQVSQDQAQAAVIRLFDLYLAAASAAARLLFPQEQGKLADVRAPDANALRIRDEAEARAWLDCELPNMLAVATAAPYAASHITRLAEVLFRYLDVCGHYSEAMRLHALARAAAHKAGDDRAEAAALAQLGLASLRQGRYAEAIACNEQALVFHRAAVDKMGEARALTNLGILAYQQGRYADAAACHQQAMAVCRELGDQQPQTRLLLNLAMVDLRLGHLQRARDCLDQALQLARELDDQFAEAYVLGNLGEVDRRQGRLEDAASHLEQSLALCRRIRDPDGEGYALANLGAVERERGRHQEASDCLQLALHLFQEVSDSSGEAETHNHMGALLLATGKPSQAAAEHSAALRLASQIGDCYEQARAHDGLASSYQAAGETSRAQAHWQQAMTLYAQLGTPGAEEVARKLASPRTHPDPAQ